MEKRKKIDFVLYEDRDEKIVFRFLPQQSSCHSFGDKPPKSWKEVYKVYYNYKIFWRWTEDNDVYELFHSHCDECSIIDGVAARIKHIVEGKETITVNRGDDKYVIKLLGEEMLPCGDGVSWTINKLHTRTQKEKWYEIVLWDSNEKGYRFKLRKDKLKEFGEYLSKCCEYMLAHGDPI